MEEFVPIEDQVSSNYCKLEPSPVDSVSISTLTVDSTHQIQPVRDAMSLDGNECFGGIYSMLADWSKAYASFSVVKDSLGFCKALSWNPQDDINMQLLPVASNSTQGFYKFRYGFGSKDFYIQKDRPFIFCVMYMQWSSYGALSDKDIGAILVLNMDMNPLLMIKKKDFQNQGFVIEDGKIDYVDGHYYSTQLEFELPVDSFEQFKVGHLVDLTNDYLDHNYKPTEEVWFKGGHLAFGDLPIWHDPVMLFPWRLAGE